MRVRVRLRVRTCQVVCFLDLDKCTIYGQDGNDLAIAMQVCVCVGGGGGVCMLQVVYTFIRAHNSGWVARSGRW